MKATCERLEGRGRGEAHIFPRQMWAWTSGSKQLLGKSCRTTSFMLEAELAGESISEVLEIHSHFPTKGLWVERISDNFLISPLSTLSGDIYVSTSKFGQCTVAADFMTGSWVINNTVCLPRCLKFSFYLKGKYWDKWLAWHWWMVKWPLQGALRMGRQQEAPDLDKGEEREAFVLRKEYGVMLC